MPILFVGREGKNEKLVTNVDCYIYIYTELDLQSDETVGKNRAM